MHPSISAFSSALFYDGLLSTPSFCQSMLPTTISRPRPSA
jgi:superfamily I DNA and/or RNA helicase